MRTIGFIFAFAFLFLGPSVAGSSSSDSLPGIGTFEFNGSAPIQDKPFAIAAVR